MKTTNGVSTSVSATDIWISLIAFVLLYLALGVADLLLMLRYSKRGLASDERSETSDQSDSVADAPIPGMAY